MPESQHLEYKRELFADRLEITSTGGILQGLTESEFFEGFSMPRNKELMRIFRDLDMVEHLGSGVPRILKAYPKFCFRFTNNFIRMSFPSSEKTSGKSAVKSAVKTPDQVLEVLGNHPDFTLQEVATHINKSLSLVEKTAAKLRKAGKLKYVGPQKGGHWKILKP